MNAVDDHRNKGGVKLGPRDEYTRRMNRVLDHIDRHLSEPIDLVGLAKVAYFSPFHFHRLFVSWMGETLGEYVRRRRLEVGALMLSHEARKSILAIALEVGFGSGEAFTRAFKLHFGVTPSSWRTNTPQRWRKDLAQTDDRSQECNPDQVVSKANQMFQDRVSDHSNSIFQEFAMNVQILQKSPVKVAFMRYIGPYGPSVTRFWQEKFLPWRQAQGLDGASCYGVGHDDPGITPAGKCRYDACVVLPNDFADGSIANIMEIPGGRYAVAHFKDEPAKVGAFWMKLLREWLPSSGMQLDCRPVFEYYPEHAFDKGNNGILECQLCLPIRPL